MAIKYGHLHGNLRGNNMGELGTQGTVHRYFDYYGGHVSAANVYLESAFFRIPRNTSFSDLQIYSSHGSNASLGVSRGPDIERSDPAQGAGTISFSSQENSGGISFSTNLSPTFSQSEPAYLQIGLNNFSNVGEIVAALEYVQI